MAESKYKPIRAETSATNSGGLRYCIPDIPIGWKLDKTDGRYDFRVVAISEDGQIVDNLSSAYLSFDESASTLTVAPVFGQKDFCVYVFRDEEAVNLFAIKSDGSASLASILAQFEKDNRVLAQLQALQGRCVRMPDECAILPDATFRKNKFLAFDGRGNPVCGIEATAFEDARAEVAAAKAAAAASASAASASAEGAQTAAERAGVHEGNASEHASNAMESASEAESAKTAAAGSASAAASSATAAAASEQKAQVSAGDCAGYAMSAYESMQAAEASATSAQNSETSANLSAESAYGSSVNAASSASAAASSASSASASASSAQSAKLAAESAKTAAQNAADNAVAISDPEGWRTETTDKISALQLCKSDNGILYFTGGAATATPDLAFDTLSVLFKTDFDFSVVQTTDLHVFFPFYIGTTGKGAFFSCQYGRSNKLTVHRAVANAAAYVGNFDRANIAPLAGNGLNALAFVFKKLSDGNTQLSLYVNGVLVPNNATAAVAFPTLDSFISINKWGSTTTSAGTVGYSDFRIFNFDVSAEDAPYKLVDYQAGKRLPPNLTGVQLALENYTFDDKIRDISGNEHHATISGSVAGDMDNSINQMYSAFSAKYTQENAS